MANEVAVNFHNGLFVFLYYQCGTPMTDYTKQTKIFYFFVKKSDNT